MGQTYLIFVASVSVQAKFYVLLASEDSGRAKIGARAKKGERLATQANRP